MKTDIRKQDIDVTWQNLNPGTVVTGGATAPNSIQVNGVSMCRFWIWTNANNV